MGQLFDRLGISDVYNQEPKVNTGSPLDSLLPPEEPTVAPEAVEAPQATLPAETSTETPEQPSDAPEMGLFERLGIDRETIPMEEPRGAIPIADLPPEIQAEHAQAKDQNEQLALEVFSPEELEAIRAKGPIGFFEAKDFLDYEDVIPGGGAVKAVESYTLIKAAEKMGNGEELSVNESELMRQYVREQVEINIRGYSIRGGIANMVSQMPAFAIEFLATGGMGKVAQKAAEKTAGKVVKNAVAKKAIGLTANLATRTALIPGQYVASYGEKRVNDFMAVTDKGNLLLEESKESPYKSALKAYLGTSIEVATEMSGASIGKYVVQPITAPIGKVASKYLRTPINSGIQKLPGSVREGIYTAYKAINPNAKVNEVFTTAGFNGVLEELGEERVAQVLHAVLDFSTDEDMTTEELLAAMTPDPQQLLIELGSFGMLGGTKASVTAVYNLALDKGIQGDAKEFAENMTENERQNFIEKNLTVRSENESLPAQPVNYEDPPGLKEIKPLLNNDESNFEAAYRNWLDDLGAIKDVRDLAESRGLEIDSSNDAEQFARNSRGVMSTIHYNLKYGTTRINPETGSQETTGKGYKDITDDADGIMGITEQNKDVRQKDFDDIRIAYSILDDYNLSQGTTPKVTPEAKDVTDLAGQEVLDPTTDTTPEVDNFQEDMKVTEQQKADADATIARITEKYGEDIGIIKQLVSESTEYSQRVLINLVDSGILSQTTYDELLAKRPNFTSLKRVMDDKGLGEIMDRNPVFSRANAAGALKKRKGSTREIKDINSTIVENTARIIDAATRNRVAVSVVNYMDIVPEHIQQVKIRPGIDLKNIITVYKDGKPEYYRVSRPLQKAMEGLDPVQIAGLQKLAIGLTGLVRAGATTFNPNFIIANPIRDVVGSTIVSGGQANLKTFVKGVTAQIFKTEAYKDWLKDGGAFDTFMDMSDAGFQKAFDELSGKKPGFWEASKWPVIKQIHDLNTLMEQAPRIGLHQKLQAEGMEGIRAAQYARDLTLDFSRRGFKGGKANQYWAFLNAGLQGSNKLYRTMKDNPKLTIGIGVATVTMPSVFLTGWFLYGADEETRAKYLEIPQWQRDLFWIVPNPKAKSGFSRVPKPFSFGFIFGSSVERLMIAANQAYRDEDIKMVWGDLAKGMVGSVVPYAIDEGSLFPTVAKPIVEHIANKNFFRDTPIYPQWLEGQDPVERKNKSTSETSQSIVEMLRDTLGVEISPAILDHYIQSYTSTIGRNALLASDMLLQEMREMSGEEVASKPRQASDFPITSAFAVRDPVGSSSQSVNDFWDTYSDLKQRNTTYKKKLNNESLESAEAYLDRYENEIYMYEDIEDLYYGEMRMLNQAGQEVYEDTAMSGVDKLEELSDIGQDVTNIAKEANQYIKDNLKDKE